MTSLQKIILFEKELAKAIQDENATKALTMKYTDKGTNSRDYNLNHYETPPDMPATPPFCDALQGIELYAIDLESTMNPIIAVSGYTYIDTDPKGVRIVQNQGVARKNDSERPGYKFLKKIRFDDLFTQIYEIAAERTRMNLELLPLTENPNYTSKRWLLKYKNITEEDVETTRASIEKRMDDTAKRHDFSYIKRERIFRKIFT